jgi:hypothetical protein
MRGIHNTEAHNTVEGKIQILIAQNDPENNIKRIKLLGRKFKLQDKINKKVISTLQEAESFLEDKAEDILIMNEADEQTLKSFFINEEP